MARAAVQRLRARARPARGRGRPRELGQDRRPDGGPPQARGARGARDGTSSGASPSGGGGERAAVVSAGSLPPREGAVAMGARSSVPRSAAGRGPVAHDPDRASAKRCALPAGATERTACAWCGAPMPPRRRRGSARQCCSVRCRRLWWAARLLLAEIAPTCHDCGTRIDLVPRRAADRDHQEPHDPSGVRRVSLRRIK